MYRIFISAFLFFSFFKILTAEGIYPDEYRPAEFHDGGSVHFGKNEYEGYLFFIKPYWTFSDAVFYRESIADSIWHAIPLVEKRYISDILLTSDNLYLLWTEKSDIFFGELDLSILKEIKSESAAHRKKYFISTKIPYGSNLFRTENIFFTGRTDNNTVIFEVDGSLFQANKKNEKILCEKKEENTAGAVVFDNGKYGFGAVIDAGGTAYAHFYDNSEVKTAGAFDLGSENYYYPLKNKIAFLSAGMQRSNYFYYQTIIPGSSSFPGLWVNSKGTCIKVIEDDEKQTLYYISGGREGYALQKREIAAGAVIGEESCGLPPNFFEPLGLWVDSSRIYAVFRNGLITVSHDCSILSADNYSFGEIFDSRISLEKSGKYLAFNGAGASVLFARHENELWLINSFIYGAGRYLLPAGAAVLLLIIVQMYRTQKRKFKTLLDIQPIGIVFFIDRSGRLTETNEAGRKFLNIRSGVSLGRHFRHYCADESSKVLFDYITKALSAKEIVSRKINLQAGGESKELSLRIIPLRNIAGSFRGLVCTALDITEELERKRLSNWAHLAHDMQTNLATIKLNTDELDLKLPENLKKRDIIKRQISILMQRVRDLVTVGRSDTINKELYDSEEICREASLEFDWERYPNIDFKIEAEKFKTACDKDIFIRALRNAIENSLKAVKDKEGEIILSCRSELRNAFYSVKDTAGGMDAKTKSKILKPYFTTSRKEGGSGIGTMIMQHVMELHDGEIIIESEKGKGTEVIFKIPNYLKRKRR